MRAVIKCFEIFTCYEHRGTDELPARVSTLEPDEEAICWGVAYCIKDGVAAEKAMSYLSVRESEYDMINTIEFFTEDSPDVPVLSEVLVFMSTLDKSNNRYYLGAAPKEDIALQIATATGPCGPNCDYLFRLVEALREIGHEDKDVTELASSVRKIIDERKMQNKQSNASLNPVSLFASQNLVPKPHLMVPAPVQMGSLRHSPRLLKSQAR
ncbi:hypothetical protein KP509_32G013800 [Ceratopteris richardii]|uniref:Gamma-glutamylcyclotransferase n=1 Tax=Ceratopteris richardii TaxID=49495 RepID=A0A8T2QT93_CERRI|nr:hypothetical protein KP509_32G013800 [Ceratopteris richardii]